MVSEKEMIPIRIKFSKLGNLMYISHLDLARTMQRIILRSGIDIWYSEGFNPQPKMVFAFPLSIGVESVCELLDIRLNSPMSYEEIKNRLESNFPEEMKVLEVYTPSVKFKNIAYIDYTITLTSPQVNENTGNEIENLFSKECVITKKTKSGEKEVNISDGVKLVKASVNGDTVSLHAILCADNERYLNPDHFIEAIKQNLNILNGDSIDEHYTILRNQMLDEELNEFK